MSANKKELTEKEKHLHHVEGGYKGTLSNPNSSEEAKEHAQEQLDRIAEGKKPEPGLYSKDKKDLTEEEKHLNHVIGGYKGTLSNANSSEEAKEHARKELKKLGVDEEEYMDTDEKKGLKRSSESQAKPSSPKKHKELTEEEKHQHHVEGGYKATLSNPSSSEEAKEHAQKQLDKIAAGKKPEEGASRKTEDLTEEEKHQHHIEGGYKATLSNPNSTEEAKKHAQKMLDKIANGEKVEAANGSEATSEDVHLHRVEGGYKATLKNPNVSEEAKEHAQKQLDRIAAGKMPEEGGYQPKSADDAHTSHVIGGYKATLSNANSSEEAKEHARKELKKLGVDEEEYEAKDDKETESDKKSKDTESEKKKGKGGQGFASMPKDKVKEIASKGGRTAHAGEQPAPLKKQ